MEVVVRDGQTLADIAVQEYGVLEAVVQLAEDNGMSVSEVPATGRALHLHDRVYNWVMRDYCLAHEVQPATLRDNTTQSDRIFNEVFNESFS